MDACGVLALTGMGSAAGGNPLPGTDILRGADARIEQIRKRDAVLILTDAAGAPLAAGTEVVIEQTGHHFLFGCNLFNLFNNRLPEENAAYSDRFVELFNAATLPFYWHDYEPVQGETRDSRTERSLTWCRENGITPKGHPLAWNLRDPKWLPPDPEAAMRLQIERIGRTMKRFPEIRLWDVVNEATAFEREEMKRDAPILTEAIRRLGVPAYLKQSFVEARRAGPAARLIINDYEVGAAFQERVLRQLVDEKGAAMYDIIGVQSHMHGGYWGAEKTWRVCDAFVPFGKPLHFTETTLTSGPTPWGSESTAEGEAAQAEASAELYTILFSHPAVEAITWWDLSDQGSWNNAAAGLLRTDMTPKPAYERLKQLIRRAWWTRVKTKTTGDGPLRFRGFRGRYRVSAVVNGRLMQGDFDLVDPGPGAVRLALRAPAD